MITNIWHLAHNITINKDLINGKIFVNNIRTHDDVLHKIFF